MEELIWQFARSNRELQNLRKDIKSVWDDDAARAINSRYLDPHESDAHQVQISLQKQYTYISEARKFRRLALEEARRIDDFSHKIDVSLEATDREMSLVFSSHEEARNLYTKTQALFPQIDQFIQSANSTCEGVLTRDEYNSVDS